MSKLNKLPSFVISDPRYFLAFGFGSGLSPIAPGTCGTLASISVYFLLMDIPNLFYLSFVIVAFLVGLVISDEITKELKVNDYKGVVWDEFVGYWLTMFLVPHGVAWICLGFVLFRFFDILKPFPIKLIENSKHSGFAIMFDDVIAALYAWLVLQLILFAW